MKQLLIIAALCFFYLFKLNAQVNDSSFADTGFNGAIAYYDSVMKGNTLLYNGCEYAYKGHNVQGFPYFESADMLIGAVEYNGNLYKNVPMHYDLESDELIITDFTKNYPIKLIDEKIKYFFLNGHKFVNVDFENSFLFIKQGFIEEIYRGVTNAFAKKEKKQKMLGKPEDNQLKYEQYNTYYIKKNLEIFVVSNKKSLLKVFTDKKDELKKFIRANKIDFKKNLEDAIVRTTAYYDQLEN